MHKGRHRYSCSRCPRLDGGWPADAPATVSTCCHALPGYHKLSIPAAAIMTVVGMRAEVAGPGTSCVAVLPSDSQRHDLEIAQVFCRWAVIANPVKHLDLYLGEPSSLIGTINRKALSSIGLPAGGPSSVTFSWSVPASAIRPSIG
jgi:hypothetical protein